MSSKSWFLLAIVLVFASAAAAAVPTDYQGYWKFDDGSGSIANDSSVNGNDGNLFGNPVWSTGKLNGALQFDGVGDYVNLGTSSFGLTSGSSTQLSIVFWVYVANVGNNQTLVTRSSLVKPFLVEFNGGRLRTGIRTASGANYLTSSAAFPTNQWVHVALTYDGSMRRIYINSAVDASVALSGAVSFDGGETTTVGTRLGSTPQYLNGTLDELQIYNRALTGTEVLDLFNAASPSPPDTTPPSVSVTSPLSGATVSGTITVSASASDNVGVSGVQFLVDGSNLGTEDVSSPYSVSWNTSSFANGSHTLTARARDAAGNTTTSSPVTVNVSNGAPPPPSGTSHYVTPNGAGFRNGNDWNSAWSISTISWSSVSPGHTIYFAGGNYNSGITVPKDGSSSGGNITLKRATQSETGSVPGWQSGFDSVVELQNIVLSERSYITIDGVVDNGMKITRAPLPFSQQFGSKVIEFGGPAPGSTTDITLKNLEVVGLGYNLCQGGSLIGIRDGGLRQLDNLLIDNVNFHDEIQVGLRLEDHTNVVLRNSDFYNMQSNIRACPPYQNNGSGGGIPCSSGCPAGTACYHGTYCAVLRPSGTPMSCSTTSNCGPASMFNCLNNQCVLLDSFNDFQPKSCSVRDDCPVGSFSCVNNRCVAIDLSTSSSNLIACTAGSQCPDAQSDNCVDGFCRPENPHGEHIAAFGVLNGFVVENNTFRNQYLGPSSLGGTGISFADTTGIVEIINNVFFHINSPVFENSDGLGPGFQYMNIVGNTFVGYRIPISYNIPMKLYNNIFCNDESLHPNSITRWAPTDALEYANNAFCEDSRSVPGGNYDYPHGINGVLIPQSEIANTFENIIGLDFRLKQGSLPINAGLNMGAAYAFDIDGTPRPQGSAWDIGAFEFASGAPGDTTPPSVSVTSPLSGATVSGTIVVSASASDNVGVSGVQFMVDGVNLGVEDVSSPYSVSWSTSSVVNGSHALSARARDAAGNTATASVVVDVNNVVAPGCNDLVPLPSGDGVVNVFDLVFVATNIFAPSPNLVADLDGDGFVTVADLVLMGQSIGETC